MTYDDVVARTADGDPAEAEAGARADGRRHADEAPRSPLEEALARVGDRWALLLVEALLAGPRRFNDLIGDLPGIAPNILSDRLKRLEREQVLVARPYTRRPPRFAYELTADGLELAGALRLLAEWGSRRSPSAEPLRHASCGTPLEARWYCTTCARPVDEGEAGDVEFL